MSRFLFEFEDCHWFRDTIRESMTDYLRYFLKASNFYKPVIPLISEMLNKTSHDRIVDLCSGSGGPVENILNGLESNGERSITITLTDKFPNINSYELLARKYPGRICYELVSIDAKNVNAELIGIRTIFSGIHHFDEVSIGKVIEDAVLNESPIGIFDGGDRNIFTALGIILLQPISFLLLTPFFRPFRISRLIFTYLIPIIPFCTVWDGVVSIVRLYSPQALEKIAIANDGGKYNWISGKVKNSFGMNVAYLIGYPS